jgi:NADH:ubiquinone oxidoreductase subunit 6 (subunit J)
MDSLHAIGFYVSATLSTGGALLVAFLTARLTRGLAMAVTGVGLAGLSLSLSAGFAAAVVLVCYLAIAAILAGPQYRSIDPMTHVGWRQAGAVGAAGLLVLLAFSAYRGEFVRATFYGGEIGGSAVGRLLFAHDAMATEAIATLLLVALVGATAAWRVRGRGR